jgi:hypothetical protein
MSFSSWDGDKEKPKILLQRIHHGEVGKKPRLLEQRATWHHQRKKQEQHTVEWKLGWGVGVGRWTGPPPQRK